MNSFSDYGVGCSQCYLNNQDFRANLALRKLQMIDDFISIVNVDIRGLLYRYYDVIQMHTNALQCSM